MREVAAELGGFGEFTTTGAGTTSTAVVGALAVSTLLQSTSLTEMFLWQIDGANALEQRYVANGGLDTTTGTIQVAPVMGSAIATSVNVWVAGRVPFIKMGFREGVRECIARAHRKLWVRHRMPITAVTGQAIYTWNRTTYWWMKPDSILEIYDPQSDATVPLRETRHRWHYDEDAELPAIVFPDGAPWNTGETPSMLVQRPASSRFKVSGIWTDQAEETAGVLPMMTALASESLANLDEVKAGALAYAYAELAKWTEGKESLEWRALQLQWEATFKACPNFMRQTPNQAGVPDLRPAGSRR
jgi:hypothetical protein